eukprot:4313307-Alexandrium_andersonii.AAC.1
MSVSAAASAAQARQVCFAKKNILAEMARVRFGRCFSLGALRELKIAPRARGGQYRKTLSPRPPSSDLRCVIMLPRLGSWLFHYDALWLRVE